MEDLGRVTDLGPITHASYQRHKAPLLGHLYRMTGSVSDAEDLLSETFRRTLERPPSDLRRDLGPFLFRVATRLAIDHLRRRRRRSAGIYLPDPWPAAPLPPIQGEAEARYETAETASLAFLHALDVLPPQRRAALLLREVYGMSTRETAEVLGISETAAKQHLTRARKSLAAHPFTERGVNAARRAAAHRTFERATNALLSGDIDTFRSLLSGDVTALSDGGGVYVAAAAPVVGRDRVAALYGGLARAFGPPKSATFLSVGGDPALLLDLDPPSAAFAPRALVSATTGPEGHLRALFTILDPAKLTRVAHDP